MIVGVVPEPNRMMGVRIDPKVVICVFCAAKAGANSSAAMRIRRGM